MTQVPTTLCYINGTTAMVRDATWYNCMSKTWHSTRSCYNVCLPNTAHQVIVVGYAWCHNHLLYSLRCWVAIPTLCITHPVYGVHDTFDPTDVYLLRVTSTLAQLHLPSFYSVPSTLSMTVTVRTHRHRAGSQRPSSSPYLLQSILHRSTGALSHGYYRGVQECINRAQQTSIYLILIGVTYSIWIATLMFSLWG